MPRSPPRNCCRIRCRQSSTIALKFGSQRPFRSTYFAVKNHKTCIDKHLRERASWSPQTLGSAVPSQKLMRAEEGEQMRKLMNRLWTEDAGQDIAEYAVMLAVILVLVVGTVRLIGSNANNVFSNAASSIQ